jgi:hypothetical protein
MDLDLHTLYRRNETTLKFFDVSGLRTLAVVDVSKTANVSGSRRLCYENRER